MAAPFHNQRVNIAFKYLRNELYKVQRFIWNDEDINGKSDNHKFILFSQLAIDYCLIIYTDITLPDLEPGSETWEDVKKRFNFEENRKNFVKQKINLLKIARFFDLETLSATNLDTQGLINLQPDNDNPVYP